MLHDLKAEHAFFHYQWHNREGLWLEQNWGPYNYTLRRFCNLARPLAVAGSAGEPLCKV